ncbi:hypothetical protein HY950_03415 [Candidatus Gottesmanbacteria bacterium]|nr:hypothetical protein [Candidatus Gottesmanbacteria bacterium]
MKKELFLVVAMAVLFVVPVLYQTRHLALRLDSDYDTVLPLYGYVAQYIREHGRIPAVFPYADFGYPTVADPLSAVLNPIFMVPLVLFGVDSGMSVVFVLLTIIAGISMWALLKTLNVSGWVRVWGATLYVISGALTARFAAGHTLFFLAYPILPLFFAAVLPAHVSVLKTLISALVITMLFFSGDIYGIWFALLFLACIRGFWIVKFPKQRKYLLIHSLGTMVLFMLFSSPKLIPVMRDIYPRMKRIFQPIFGEGSIHAILTPLFYIVPFRETFYDRPFFRRLLGFHFNWYEYYAFISPLPFVLLLYIRKVWKKDMVRLVVVLLVMGMLYIAQRHPYSPFYWLFQAVPGLSILRVPQRMAMYAMPLVIALCALCANGAWNMKNKRILLIVLLSGSIVWTYIVSRSAFLVAYEAPRTEEQALVWELRKHDSSNFSVVTHVCCMQRFLVRDGITIYNYYFPWRDKSFPDSEEVIEKLRPKYVIAKLDLDIRSKAYYPLFETRIARVWKSL